MKNLIKAAVLMLGMSIFLSCNKDSMTGKSLVGKWEFQHFEWTTTTGEVLDFNDFNHGEKITWTFTEQMVTIEEKNYYGDETSETYSYEREKDVLLINTWLKTMITEGNLFNVEGLSKSELTLVEVDAPGVVYHWNYKGGPVDVKKVAIVFRRVN